MVIFKGDCARLQAINLTAFTTGDLVFLGGKKFLPVGVSSQQNNVRWNSLLAKMGAIGWVEFSYLFKSIHMTVDK